MLSREHSELLTRTGPGAPLGDLIRRYWIPALLSEEIPRRTRRQPRCTETIGPIYDRSQEHLGNDEEKRPPAATRRD